MYFINSVTNLFSFPVSHVGGVRYLLYPSISVKKFQILISFFHIFCNNIFFFTFVLFFCFFYTLILTIFLTVLPLFLLLTCSNHFNPLFILFSWLYLLFLNSFLYISLHFFYPKYTIPHS